MTKLSRAAGASLRQIAYKVLRHLNLTATDTATESDILFTKSRPARLRSRRPFLLSDGGERGFGPLALDDNGRPDFPVAGLLESPMIVLCGCGERRKSE